MKHREGERQKKRREREENEGGGEDEGKRGSGEEEGIELGCVSRRRQESPITKVKVLVQHYQKQ